MAGLFALSTSERFGGSFSSDLYWGSFYQQHLGEIYAGVSIINSHGIQIQTHKGLFRSCFPDSEGFSGKQGIGYCGSDREPFPVDSKTGQWHVCFSGTINNRKKLIDHFLQLGHIFEKRGIEISDIEIIAKLIGQGKGLVEGIERVVRQIQGTFVILILTEKGIIAARSPDGHWPLVIGKKRGAFCLASESGGFSNIGFQLVRDVKPGEILQLSDGKMKVLKKILSPRVQICSFLWVYTTFATSVVNSISASLVRKRLGASLARRDIESGFIPDVVAPVPDSGRHHALGYFEEFCRQFREGKIKKLPMFDEVISKYPHSGRSYMPKTQEERTREAQSKLLSSGQRYDGLVLVICDDSVVRGTQIQTNLVPKLSKLGFKEVHARISDPELLAHCPWGKTTKRGEILACRLPKISDREEFLGVTTLRYNTIADLVRAIGLSAKRLCVDCNLQENDW